MGTETETKTLIKYCGCQSKDDLVMISGTKADYAGLIFAPSKRRVTPENAGRWIKEIQSPLPELVGVFVNAELEEIEHAMNSVPLDVIQCHGDESPEELKKIKWKTGKQVWKAIRHDEEGWKNLKEFEGIADGYVIDARVAGAYGGTGTAFDWKAVPSYLEEASQQKVPCLIAGGIDASNVSKLLTFRPHGIDVSSGIEKNGVKDLNKITELEGMMNNENSIS